VSTIEHLGTGSRERGGASDSMSVSSVEDMFQDVNEPTFRRVDRDYPSVPVK